MRSRPQHGYGIARRIEQVSQQVLQLNEGTVYTSLLRLQQRKWIASEWGAQELDDEIETHLCLLTERYVRQGMTEAEAARAARRQFGNVTLLQEGHRRRCQESFDRGGSA